MYNLNFKPEADHNLFILATTDKNNRLICKLFLSDSEKVLAGMASNSTYMLAFSIHREDASLFMRYYKKQMYSPYFDGWVSITAINNLISLLENKNYSRFDVAYREVLGEGVTFHLGKDVYDENSELFKRVSKKKVII